MTKVAIIGSGPCGLSMLRAFQQAEAKGERIPEITFANSSRGPSSISSTAMVPGEASTEIRSMPSRGTNWELRKKKNTKIKTTGGMFRTNSTYSRLTVRKKIRELVRIIPITMPIMLARSIDQTTRPKVAVNPLSRRFGL